MAGEAPTLAAARYYLKHGWMPIPVPAKSKFPPERGWQNWRFTEAELPRLFSNGSNIGLLNGEPSGWLIDNDLDWPEAIHLAKTLMTPTDMIHGRPGKLASHWWYVVDRPIQTKSFEAPGGSEILRVGSTGSQTIVPPSTHPETGERIAWAVMKEPPLIDGRILLNQAGRVAAGALLARNWPDGNRHKCALALAGALLRRGWLVDDVRSYIEDVCGAAGDEETADRMRAVDYSATSLAEGRPTTGVPRLIEYIGRPIVERVATWLGWEPPTAGAPPPGTFQLSDYGNAERLIATHGRDLRYCQARGGWFIYVENRWKLDEKGEVVRRAKETVRAVYAEALATLDEDRRKKVAAHAVRSEGEGRIKAMIALAASESGIPVLPGEFDADPWALNCANGTLDLRTGTLYEHRRDDLLTKLAPVEYVPGARLPLWERFLSEALHDPAEEVFIRRWLGYCATGDTREEKMALFHGRTATGKSTMLEAVKAALGDYAHTADFSTFLAQPTTNAPRNDIAELVGARMVVSIEVERGRRLAAGLVKTLIGGDTIRARRLYQEAFEFRPKFKLCLCANDKPTVHDDDDAIWRRVLVVPLDRQIPPERRDPAVKATLRNPAIAGAAILDWLVRGCLEWLAHGLGIPTTVKNATDAYRTEMDPLAEFVEQCCVLDPEAVVTASKLRQAYDAWADENGVDKKQRPGSRAWGKRWKEKGCTPDRKETTRLWRGVRLMTE